MADEGLLETAHVALFHDGSGRVAHQDTACVHERDPVAAFCLVHEMGGDEDGDVVPACQADHDAPEGVPLHRVHPRGGFVQDQRLRAVDHGGGERELLEFAQGQCIGQGVHDVGEIEALGHLRHPARDPILRYAVEPGVQDEILPHREFVVE